MAKVWKKAVFAALGVLVIGGGINAAMAAGRDDTPAQQPAQTVDVKGNCDEAEHANDPECQGPQIPEDEPTALGDDRGGENEVRGRDAEPGEDISGPCDEAEHANDPRCAGGQTADDNRGPGHGDDDGQADDNSGPSENSGPGSGDDDGQADDNSGPSDDSGHSDDRGGDDNSGPGGGGSDD